jgi:carbonic anhydrase
MKKSRQFPQSPTTLLITCADGRFLPGIGESIGPADVIALPGGPGLFNYWSAPYASTDAVQRSMELLITAHGIKRIVLVAHEDCAYYGRTSARQLEDLQFARQAIAKTHPKLSVDTYYATIEEDDAVSLNILDFEPQAA